MFAKKEASRLGGTGKIAKELAARALKMKVVGKVVEIMNAAKEKGWKDHIIIIKNALIVVVNFFRNANAKNVVLTAVI